MNRLPSQKRVQILSMLLEGSSMWLISRVVGVSINTVTKLLTDAGETCAAYQHEHVRGMKSQRVQCNEIWSFCCAKQKNVATAKVVPEDTGDVWTWTALDTDSKLIVSYLIGGRDSEYAIEFIDGVASRLANRIQMTTDGYRVYLEEVAGAFGGDIDFAQLVKLYGAAPVAVKGRNNSAECAGTCKRRVEGNPVVEDVSTSNVERRNLTMHMSMRRSMRLTNAFSKKIDNHIHMLSLYFMHYNFCRQNKLLEGVSPAMAAGISDTLHDMEWIVGLVDDRAPKPGPRRPHKKNNSN